MPGDRQQFSPHQMQWRRHSLTQSCSTRTACLWWWTVRGAAGLCGCAGGQTSTRRSTQRRLPPHLQQHFGVELVGVGEGSEPAELWVLLGTARTRYLD